MQRSAQLMSFFLPGHEMQEAQNKLQAFRLFAYVDQELRFPEDRPLPLGALVRRAMALSHHRRIFALEGVAHYHTAAESGKGRVSGLLLNPALPDCAMVSMHAGMGTYLRPARRSRNWATTRRKPACVRRCCGFSNSATPTPAPAGARMPSSR